MTEPRELVLLSRAETVLAEARSLDEVKDLCDRAAAVKAYAKKARLGQHIVAEAAAIKLRAERRLGQMLQSIQLADSAPGNQYTGPGQYPPDADGRIHLRDLGLTKTDSSRSQRLARLPEDFFERYLNENVHVHREPTLAGLFRSTATRPSPSAPPPPVPLPVREAVGLANVAAAGHRFATVYADPPWPQAKRGPQMTVEEIAAQPVADVCEADAHLHIWATNKSLPDALAVMAAWGFVYRSCLVCLNREMGNGSYWQESHQFLLFGMRGRLPFKDRNQPSWIECDWPKDGGQPPSLHQLIETVSPGPYLELFGSGKVFDQNWTNIP